MFFFDNARRDSTCCRQSGHMYDTLNLLSSETDYREVNARSKTYFSSFFSLRGMKKLLSAKYAIRGAFNLMLNVHHASN